MKKKRYFSRTVIVLLAILFAFLFVMPTLLTITNSFMTQSEITANYGQVFDNAKDGKSYISKTINLKFIPDKVSFSQYWTVLLKSPDYIYKLWNSIILTVPIVFAQLMVASIAAYGFTRWRGKIRDGLFFAYVILMLMPYQVTLVPNYLVSDWLGLLNTKLGRALWQAAGLPDADVHSGGADRVGQARRRERVACILGHLPAAVPQCAVFGGDPGVHRLLEHGRAAAHPAARRRYAAAFGLSFHHQCR